jgi:heptosyltransferase II
VRGSPWHDDVIEYAGKGADGRKIGFVSAVRKVAAGNFDTGVLLSNSFRSALMLRLANVTRRVGYDRDARGLLLTDRLVPYIEDGRFLAQPMVRYYQALSRYLGCDNSDARPELHRTEQETADARALLTRNGVNPDRPYIALNPGAAFGSSKMWGADKFAEVADEIVRRGRHQVVVLCAPNERPIANAIHEAQRRREGVANFRNETTELGAIKAVIAGADLLVTNDSGPRHFAIAFDRPVVTIFGPTDPAWTECNHPKELQLRARVHCTACHLRTCPIDHRCMTRIAPDMVLHAADVLLGRFAPAAASA